MDYLRNSLRNSLRRNRGWNRSAADPLGAHSLTRLRILSVAGEQVLSKDLDQQQCMQALHAPLPLPTVVRV